MTTIVSSEPVFNPGDYFELEVSPATLRRAELPLAPALNSFLTQAGSQFSLDTPQGAVPLEHDPNAGILRGSGLTALADRAGMLRLACISTAPWRFRLRLEPALLVHVPDAPVKTERGVALAFNATDNVLLGNDQRAFASLREFRLSLQAARLAMVAGFDQLLALPWLHEVELLEHQLRTARTVLRRMRGRALLGDEVGLGKTIEAGMILLELVVRGLARRVLVLTPPSLTEQWQGELRRKFTLDFVLHDDPLFREQGAAAWEKYDRIIASYHTAKREPHRSAILAQDWDVVIVDEAHHFRNRQTQLWRMAAELRKKYILLLTATPVQNNLEELFNLVTLLQPGLLSTARVFQKQFVDRHDKLLPRNVEQLRDQLEQVMVRNRRATVGLQLTRRVARTYSVALEPAERALYDAVSQFVRVQLRAAAEMKNADARSRPRGRSVLSRMVLLTLQKELGSSTRAALPTLERLAFDERLAADAQTHLQNFAETASRIETNAKAERLLELLREFPDKIVVFTQFRETQNFLLRRLSAAGEHVAVFHGSLPRLEKEAAIRQFMGPARILLSTDAGSEGRNLQFCNAILNFDLPWNPMKIEQRVGRLSRIGQTRDVYVFNLVAADTLEAAMLYLLEAKIAMFELVIGEIDMILGNLDQEQEFEDVVTDLWVQSRDPSEFRSELDRLGDRLLAAKQAYLEQRAYEDKLFGERFVPE